MQFKKAVGLAAAATMMLAMSATAFAADGDVYAKFCKDGQGSGSVSMVQKAVAGKSEVTVDEAKDCYKITIPVKVFTHSMESFSGTGQLTSLTVNGEVYTADYENDGDNDPDTGVVTIWDTENVFVDEETGGFCVDTDTYLDVTTGYNILMGTYPMDMASDADLYFSSELAKY